MMTIGDWVYMVLRYLVCAAVSVAASIFVWVFALTGILPLLSFTTKNGNLPCWCSWLQTHDAPLDALWIGEEGATHRLIHTDSYPWLYKHTNDEIAASNWLKYRARRAWLIRNPAYGLANAMGVNKAGLIELRHTTATNREFWLYQTPDGRYFFTLLWRGRAKYGYKSVGNWPRMMVATSNPFKK